MLDVAATTFDIVRASRIIIARSEICIVEVSEIKRHPHRN